MKPTFQEISGLEVLSSKHAQAKNAVILFHGYGANMHDLFPLVEVWAKPETDFYFPNGILKLDMGAWGGRAWFPIDMQKIQMHMMRGEHRNMDEEVPEGYDELMNKLENIQKSIYC